MHRPAAIVQPVSPGATRKGLSLIPDFGPGAPIARSLLHALANALPDLSLPSKTSALFAKWRGLCGQVAGLSNEQLDQIVVAFPFNFAGHRADQVPASLFVLHTYNALLAKLLAAETLAAHGLAAFPSYAQKLASLSDDLLLAQLDNLENGRFFASLGLPSFFDDPTFSWYLYANTSDLPWILGSLRDLLNTLAQYDLRDWNNHSDLLRDFYQALVPDTLRKSLGEFYTPDWLVEFTLDQVGELNWIQTRTLDPTCGSGSFLWEVLRRKRCAARLAGLCPDAELTMLLDSIHGFDLNPLAVLCARTNFLIAIADLLPSIANLNLTLPVLLTDAICTVPNLDGPPFDLIVGNPPWVKWSKLPIEYRAKVQVICRSYDIFSSSQHHGGSELDISGMILIRTADCWLKLGGRLAFVLTQTLFQSPSSEGIRKFRLAEESFLSPMSLDDFKAVRPFPDAANKTVVAVFHKTQSAPSYPVPYRIWQAAKNFTKKLPASLSKNEILTRLGAEAKEASPVGNEGAPWAILEPGSLTLLAALAGRSDWVHGRKGITADLNGIYFVPVVDQVPEMGLVQIRTRPEAGRIDIGPAKDFWIEPDLLFPLLKGASDFDVCFVNPTHGLFAIVPNRGITQAAYDYSLAELQEKYPGLIAYFNTYEKNLEARSTFRTRMPGAPSFAVYNVGNYSFAPYKVVWAEQRGSFRAAVAKSAPVPLVGLRPLVADHKVFFVDFEDESAANYLCGLLNAPIVREYVDAHVVPTQVGDVFKHMRLPRYDEGDRTHQELAKEVKAAHDQADPALRAEIVEKVRRLGNRIVTGNRGGN